GRCRLRRRQAEIDARSEHEYPHAFKHALAFGRKDGAGRMSFDAAAGKFWDEIYREQLSIRRPGLFGAACGRAEAHTLRLAMLYALLDQSRAIRLKHVEAALALWH